jgi:ABC-type dipeptide/oligopeptide/nickel transport system permease component
VFSFFIRKIAQGLLMTLLVSAISFALLSRAGGDAFTALRDNPQISDSTIAQLRAVYGLDQPAPIRYFRWLASAAAGDLGESIHFRVSVTQLVLSRLYCTALLGLAAIGMASVAAVALSYSGARARSRRVDRVIEVIIIITASTPRIALALFTLALFVAASQTTLQIRSGSLTAFFLSAFVLAVPLIALFTAQANTGLRSAMGEDFVKLARSKGLAEGTVIAKHASRSALNPLLTVFGLSLGGVIGGAVIVETILGWQGIGELTVTAVRVRDVPLVMGIVIVSTLAVWMGNLIGELLQMANDSRLRARSLS